MTEPIRARARVGSREVNPIKIQAATIRLPRSILVILPTEQLHQYLSRVAAAAMSAATD